MSGRGKGYGFLRLISKTMSRDSNLVNLGITVLSWSVIQY